MLYSAHYGFWYLSLDGGSDCLLSINSPLRYISNSENTKVVSTFLNNVPHASESNDMYLSKLISVDTMRSPNVTLSVTNRERNSTSGMNPYSCWVAFVVDILCFKMSNIALNLPYGLS